KGNLASSLTLDLLPLTDPYQLAQSLAALNLPHRTAIIGAAIVLGFYLLFGGRLYCPWVCPMNPVTDAAAWLRRKLQLRASGRTPPRDPCMRASAPPPPTARRAWLLAATLVGSPATATTAWDWVKPVSMFPRALAFGSGAVWALGLGVSLYALLVAARGWCGH